MVATAESLVNNGVFAKTCVPDKDREWGHCEFAASAIKLTWSYRQHMLQYTPQTTDTQTNR